MKLGIVPSLQYENSVPVDDAWRSVREIGTLVDRSGFDSLWLGEHHVTADSRYLQNIPVLAALANETEHVTLSTGVLLLPLHNPVLIAEIGSTIDIISGGRFQLACGLGYRDQEFDAFGVEKGDRVGRFEESIEVIRRLWTEDNVTFDGRHFTLTDATINPKPVQRPRPTIIVAGFVDATAQRAAAIGDSWFAGHFAHRDELSRQITVYSDAADESERDDERTGPVVLREGFVLPDGDEAFDTIRPHLLEKYAGYSDWGLQSVDLSQDFREVSQGRFLIGSPEDMIEELERYAEIGVGHVALHVHFPGMRTTDVLRCIETIADDVLPHLPEI